MERYVRRSAVGLCAFMIVWVTVIQTLLELDLLRSVFPSGISPLTTDLVEKFFPHSAVRVTHHLGAVLWSSTAIMQLNASLRKRSPSVHRASGYVFFLSCGLLTAGFFIIDQRQLHAKNIWMPDTDDAHPFLERLPLHAIMAWFVITALLAWYQAAIRRDFKAHQRFMYRHLAAGLWVAVQRILYSLALPALKHKAGPGGGRDHSV